MKQSDFEQILRDKLRQGTQEFPAHQTDHPKPLSHGFYVQADLFSGKFVFQARTSKGFYKASSHKKTPDSTVKRPMFEAKASSQPAAEQPKICFDDLKPQQQVAFQGFQRLGARLCHSFSSTELKKEYRRLVRLYHPDVGQDNSERFLLLQQCWESLRQLKKPQVQS